MSTNENKPGAEQQASQKIRILKYSDKNPNFLTENETTKIIDKSTSSNSINPNDIHNDYVLSNKLNDVVLSNSIELHYFVYHNDKEGVQKYIKKHRKQNPKMLSDYLSIRDLHGNTPLHLAAMLGHVEIARLLLENGAITKCRNKNMWTPLNEAISYGNRELVKVILEKFEKEVENIVNTSKPIIIGALKEMDNFYVEVTWNFESWIPIVSRFLPSDVCKLYKYGTKLRVDCTLGDIARASKNGNAVSENGINSSSASAHPFSWQRGDLTFLFDIESIGDKNKKNSIIFMDNKRQTFVYIDKHTEMEEQNFDKETDMLLSREMVFLKLQTKEANFLPTQVGWFSKRDKYEEVNGYMCNFYDVNGLYIVSKLRTEHISDEDLKKKEEKQKKMKEQLTRSHFSRSKSNDFDKSSNGKANSCDDFHDLDDFDDDKIDHPGLPPPEKTNVSWNEYINSDEGKHPTLGRSIRSKESRKEFKAQLAMSQEFPLTIGELNKLLDALVPLAKFRKLKEFINLKLPPGFPVKIDIPIVPTVTAKVSFKNFSKNYNFSNDQFKVPDHYKEENIGEASQTEQVLNDVNES